MSFDELDSIYQNGDNADPTRAVYKSEDQSNLEHSEYMKLLQELGNFLKQNDFEWDQPTDGFNRIYYESDGSIDYFIFSFRGPGSPDKEKETEFTILLNKFIADYKINLTADRKFSQCGSIRYMPD